MQTSESASICGYPYLKRLSICGYPYLYPGFKNIRIRMYPQPFRNPNLKPCLYPLGIDFTYPNPHFLRIRMQTSVDYPHVLAPSTWNPYDVEGTTSIGVIGPTFTTEPSLIISNKGPKTHVCKEIYIKIKSLLNIIRNERRHDQILHMTLSDQIVIVIIDPSTSIHRNSI